MTKDEQISQKQNFHIYLGQMDTFKTHIFIFILCNKKAFPSTSVPTQNN